MAPLEPVSPLSYSCVGPNLFDVKVADQDIALAWRNSTSAEEVETMKLPRFTTLLQAQNGVAKGTLFLAAGYWCNNLDVVVAVIVTKDSSRCQAKLVWTLEAINHPELDFCVGASCATLGILADLDSAGCEHPVEKMHAKFKGRVVVAVVGVGTDFGVLLCQCQAFEEARPCVVLDHDVSCSGSLDAMRAWLLFSSIQIWGVSPRSQTTSSSQTMFLFAGKRHGVRRASRAADHGVLDICGAESTSYACL